MVTKLLSIFFLFLFFGYACVESSGEATSEAKITKKRPPLPNLMVGDILVKKGRGLLSHSIAKKLGEKVPLSHCGLVFRQGDSLCIVHAVAKELTGIDGVQLVSLDDFYSDCMEGYFYAVRIKSGATQKHISNIASNYLVKKTPFDYTINYGDSTKVNCSEFVYQVLKRAGSPNCFSTIEVENKKILAFNSLLDSTNFTIIYHY